MSTNLTTVDPGLLVSARVLYGVRLNTIPPPNAEKREAAVGMSSGFERWG